MISAWDGFVKWFDWSYEMICAGFELYIKSIMRMQRCFIKWFERVIFRRMK
ncbi:MAG: hypothetical protein GY855_13550 [candidate division Zixibacteria bacterium]|nr:hypothetical protein [candidate division Zixibacteria bacterium]